MQVLIFLNGFYDDQQRDFYLKAISRKVPGDLLIAVDGALDFLAELECIPDLLVGDMDSVNSEVLASFSSVPRLEFPTHKDWTDGELAIRESIKRGAEQIVLYGALDRRGEIDHMLGNIFGLALAKRLAKEGGRSLEIKISEPEQEILLLENEEFLLQASGGTMVSLLPLSDKVQVWYDGFRYPRDQSQTVEVCFGDSRTLRNELVRGSGSVQIKGRAILIVR